MGEFGSVPHSYLWFGNCGSSLSFGFCIGVLMVILKTSDPFVP